MSTTSSPNENALEVRERTPGILASWRLKFGLWCAVTVMAIAWVGMDLSRDVSDRRRILLPGKTTHGHHQIEMACGQCHTPMMGIREEACIECHRQDLENDTHPAKKFNDPSNAEMLSRLDAQSCATCHEEHVEERTVAMGLTVPVDYCVHCHDDISQQRHSHEDLAFDTCLNAGCHNYHDNSALYEAFLEKHLDDSDLSPSPRIAVKAETASDPLNDADMPVPVPLQVEQADAPTQAMKTELLQDWVETKHAVAGVNCRSCHAPDSSQWADEVSLDTCANCHTGQYEGFVRGKHGMRLASDLDAMLPSQARLPMKATAAHRHLNCTSCHPSHRFDRTYAAVDACMSCHDDEHTRAYKSSRHFELWQDEMEHRAASGTGVSCATCHMPATVSDHGDVFTQHNQNANLQPNEKMVRTVCLECHGLGFALDSLADRELIRRSFDRLPQHHVESLDMVKAWFQRKSQRKRRD